MASDPLKDTSLEEAQKEIHRRLLREEQLKRIEAEEMRRLAASSWKPPIERTATAGASVHAAADAIEETERRRSAYAQEAQRRAEEQLRRSRVPSAPALDKYRLIPPAGAGDNRALHQELDESQHVLQEFEQFLREEGQTRGADMFKRYLDRTGGHVIFKPEDFRAYDVVRDAEDGLLGHFINWMTLPPGDPSLTWLSPKLLSMKDGDVIVENVHRDRRFQYPKEWMLAQTELFDTLGPDADLYSFAGEAMLRGDAKFRIKRQGNEFKFDGVVGQHFDEPFNFEEGGDFPVPEKDKLIPRVFRGEEGALLQQHQRAKEFDMSSQWVDRVTGTLRLDSNGNLVPVGAPSRTRLDPHWARVLTMQRGPAQPNSP